MFVIIIIIYNDLNLANNSVNSETYFYSKKIIKSIDIVMVVARGVTIFMNYFITKSIVSVNLKSLKSKLE